MSQPLDSCLIAPSALLVFDFDSTLVSEESLVTLLQYSLEEQYKNQQESELIQQKLDEIKHITNQGIKGEIDMKTSYKKRLNVARPNKKHLERYLQRPVEQIITQKMDLVIDNVRSHYPSVPIHVVSQGPRVIVEHYSKLLFGIPSENVHAVNVDFPEEGSENTHDFVKPDDEVLSKGKSAVLNEVVDGINSKYQSTNTKIDHIIVVGDGVSDMNMKHKGPATVAIGFGAHLLFHQTKALADYYVTDCDQLNQILLQNVLRDCVTVNFYPGPAVIPTEVMLKTKENLLCFDRGISVLEYSHRAPKFLNIVNNLEKKLREIVNIPEDYAVLFLQGGASTQFSAIPLNLCENTDNTAAYVVSGVWSKKAYQEAKSYIGNNAIQYSLEECDKIRQDESYSNLSYVYFCDNETVHGVEKQTNFLEEVAKDGKVIVCDMSSNFLSRPVDVRKYGVLYACAQKNFGAAGLTIVVIRKDLIKEKETYVPTMLDYQALYEEKSLLNTPVTFAIYIADLIMDWIKDNGGLTCLDELAKKRSNLLYECIDNSALFECPVRKEIRSRMNIVFKIKDEKLEKTFLSESEKVGLVGLAGHRMVGGFRASLYNGMSLYGVEKLIAFIHSFENKYQK